ncbi:MAG: heavy metal translocating P-type ATPase [Treponema sp.]|nr:heavy metal translocating P-type ATPase [Candidatus Treponema merdequi]
MTKKQKKVFIRIIISIILMTLILLCPEKIDEYKILNRGLKFWLCLIPYFVIGYDILIKAFKGIIHGQPCDENFLMALATAGALALGEKTEGVAVMLFYQIGELFQSIAVGKSRKSISALMDIRPDYANLETENGKCEIVDPESVVPGSTIVVMPGEKIPLDGKIIEGTTTLDTSALTGESIPREVNGGDEVLSGCINLSGMIKVCTSKAAGESTASKILELVQNAGSRKSKSENFISKFAKIYTPAVCIAALALAIIPPAVNFIFFSQNENFFNALRSQYTLTWVYRALTFLVISCPCALVISIPLSFFAGIGAASSNGILVKGSSFIEALSKVKYLVFDKTGTMTKGVFEVTGVHHSTLENEKLLEYAALAESFSNHPISRSLAKAFGREIDKSRVKDVKEISGHGVMAFVDGKEVLIGNDKLMKRENIAFIDCHHEGTIVHIAIEKQYAGHIVISDVIKPDAKDAVKKLKENGILKTVMLTGDTESVAEKVAQEIQIDEVYSGLLPCDKVSKVEELLAEKKAGSLLAFVGDGINDAPVLTRSDVGISMGAIGSDAAIEASDVVLMDDSPLKIVKAIKIAKQCMRIVYENIGFALFIKALCLVLGAFGIGSMWFAIFADVGVMVLCVINAIGVFLWQKKIS